MREREQSTAEPLAVPLLKRIPPAEFLARFVNKLMTLDVHTPAGRIDAKIQARCAARIIATWASPVGDYGRARPESAHAQADRFDGERMSAMDRYRWSVCWSDLSHEWVVKDFTGRALGRGSDPRDALDDALRTEARDGE